MVNTFQDKFKVGHLNTRSLAASFGDVSNLIITNCFDVFAVTGSWIYIILHIPDYRLI